MRRFIGAAVVALAIGCAGAAGQDEPDPVVDSGAADAAAPPEAASAPDAGGCGLTLEQAEAAFPGEELCPTIVYGLSSGYCRHFVPCDSF